MKHQIILEFFFELSRTNASLLRRLSSHGLDFSDFMILSFLSSAPDGKLRRIDLAQKMGLSASGITRMILPLEKIGLVSRDLSENDGRARFSSLTKVGQQFLDEAKIRITEKLEELIPAKQEDKFQQATSLLKKINL